MEWHWPNFSQDELKCPCCGVMGMQPDFLDDLQEFRKAYGKPMPISSGYRCFKYNAKVSSTGDNGPHTTGRAVDVLAGGRAAYELLKLAFEHGFTGIGVSQKGTSRFIHLDKVTAGPRPNVWSY